MRARPPTYSFSHNIDPFLAGVMADVDSGEITVAEGIRLLALASRTLLQPVWELTRRGTGCRVSDTLADLFSSDPPPAEPPEGGAS